MFYPCSCNTVRPTFRSLASKRWHSVSSGVEVNSPVHAKRSILRWSDWHRRPKDGGRCNGVAIMPEWWICQLQWGAHRFHHSVHAVRLIGILWLVISRIPLEIMGSQLTTSGKSRCLNPHRDSIAQIRNWLEMADSLSIYIWLTCSPAALLFAIILLHLGYRHTFQMWAAFPYEWQTALRKRREQSK